MDAVRTSAGATVLFVSHNMVAVANLCNRVVWLADGRVMDNGPSKDVVGRYLGLASGQITDRVWEDIGSAPGDDEIRFHRMQVRPLGRQESGPITTQTPLAIEIDYWNLKPDNCLSLSLHLYDQDGTRLFSTAPVHEPVWYGRPFPKGLFKSICHIPDNLLNDGTIRVQVLAVKDRAAVSFEMDYALVFNVIDASERQGGYLGKWLGAVRPALHWETELINTRETENLRCPADVGETL
jgi:lipopolysaccharide transport system ATP-binding protein